MHHRDVLVLTKPGEHDLDLVDINTADPGAARGPSVAITQYTDRRLFWRVCPTSALNTSIMMVTGSTQPMISKELYMSSRDFHSEPEQKRVLL